MDHYCCDKCGVYLCTGDCDKEEYKGISKSAINDARRVMYEEVTRLSNIKDARELLIRSGEWDNCPDSYKRLST